MTPVQAFRASGPRSENPGFASTDFVASTNLQRGHEG